MTAARKWSIAWLAIWFIPALAVGVQPYDLSRTLGSPSLAHPLGFDAMGRDLILLTLHASRKSMIFALGATSAALIAGLILGTALVFAPARLRFVFERMIDFFLAFPSLLIALAAQAFLGPGVSSLLIALGLGILPLLIRFVYVRAIEVTHEDYFDAARALGARDPHLALRHLGPALMDFLRIKAPYLFAQTLLAEATLTFLSIGAPPGTDTWGSLLAQGKDYLLEMPSIAIGCGLPLVFTILTLQTLSDRPSEK